MFNSFEEVQAKYPIGTKMNYTKEEHTQNFFFARPEDLIEFRKEYREVEVIEENMAKCTWDIENYDLVDGYIYDGKDWYPATITWDGWLPIEEEHK